MLKKVLKLSNAFIEGFYGVILRRNTKRVGLLEMLSLANSLLIILKNHMVELLILGGEQHLYMFHFPGVEQHHRVLL